jgi:hypothetical protein
MDANNREDQTVRKILIALAATTGLTLLGAVGASAATSTPNLGSASVSAIHPADWYCGPRCQYWHHRRWVERHRWWHAHHYPAYGYNYYYYGYYR